MKIRNKLTFGQIVSSLDYWILFLYLAIVCFGIACIFSSEHLLSDGVATGFWGAVRTVKQTEWFLLSLFCGTLVVFVINPKLYDRYAPPLYLFSLVLLVAVIFLGIEVNGSHSWFSFGPVRFQPAEFAKITTALMLASVMSQSTFSPEKPRNKWEVLLIIAIPVLVIIAEKETGSALVFASLYVALYREGFSGWLITFAFVAVVLFVLTLFFGVYMALAVLAALAFVVYVFQRKLKGVWKFILIALLVGIGWIFSVQYVFNNVLKDYQRGRIEVLLGLRDDPMGLGYNVSQSMIAIGSGGLTGKGYLQGTQTTLGFIPEQSTDFIFCTVGEEFGFVGCAVLIVLFVALICRICFVATRSKSRFAEIYGYCLACYLAFHVIVNISMTIGLMPVIGIPLPMFSYGGSSLLCFSLMIFIFLALVCAEKNY